MGYGRLYASQQVALKPFLEGRTVFDLGAGDLVLSHLLVELGAQKVVAIDKDGDYDERRYLHVDPVSGIPEVRNVHAQIEVKTQSFRSLVSSLVTSEFTRWVEGGDGEKGWPEVVFLSWPLNCEDPHRDALVRAAQVVAYLGKNTDGVACGSAGLFVDLCQRELLAHVPVKSGLKGNVLIVVGRTLPSGPREPVPEEIAAISGCDLGDRREPQGSRWEIARLLARCRVGLVSLEETLEALALRVDRFSVDELTHLVEVAHEMEGFEEVLRTVSVRKDVSPQVRKAARAHREVLGPRIAERVAFRRDFHARFGRDPYERQKVAIRS